MTPPTLQTHPTSRGRLDSTSSVFVWRRVGFKGCVWLSGSPFLPYALKLWTPVRGETGLQECLNKRALSAGPGLHVDPELGQQSSRGEGQAGSPPHLSNAHRRLSPWPGKTPPFNNSRNLGCQHQCHPHALPRLHTGHTPANCL